MKDFSTMSNYEILGVKEYSTNGEITEAYNALKSKYSEERFLPGEAGNEAAAWLQAVNTAYDAIMTERRADGFVDKPNHDHGNASENSEKAETSNVSSVSGGSSGNKGDQSPDGDNSSPKKAYENIDKLIRAGKIDDAQHALDDCDERLAEWHYLQAVVYYKKNWGNECKKQLEIAMTKDPDNEKYKTTYEKLKKELEFKNSNFTSGNASEGNDGQRKAHKDFDPYDRQMGGDGCMQSMCECCACNMMLNICCNGCCR
ncbi:MAG: hypothetical protein MRZ91_05835 [Christensenellaceae bacterium]|nr:hypothetical protein [Christensenellaceae bacterium]MDY2851221.1 hypothetical protein [Christensenellaceae bacterium]